MLPGNPESLYEIGFILFKRKSIFIISSIQFFCSFGMVILYFVLIGNSSFTLWRDILDLNDDASDLTKLLTSKQFTVLLVSLILLSIVLKRELQELHIVSLTLFFAILCFIVILIIQLLVFHAGHFADGDEIDF